MERRKRVWRRHRDCCNSVGKTNDDDDVDLNDQSNHFRENCTLKDNQLAERGREVAALKAELAKKEKEVEELDERTTLEIREKKKKIAELESDISENHQTIEKLTSDKNGLLNEVESLKSSLSQQG